MTETEIEETPEAQPSTSRKVTVGVITLIVAVVVGMAATGITEKINAKIREKMLDENE